MAANSWAWDFDYDSYGAPGWEPNFGVADIQAAQGMGYTNAQIRILGQKAGMDGRFVGDGAREWIEQNTQKGPWDYAAHGGAHFGQADVQAATASGSKYGDIKRFADYATQNKIGVGDYATQWLADNKDTRAYMTAADQQKYDDDKVTEQRAYVANQTKIAEDKAAALWKEQQAAIKKANPQMTSTNRQLQSGSAGGVRINRSNEWKNQGTGGRNRGTSALGRGLLIGGLNI